MRKRERGQVITFYSFKGGVGRSMAVANVATIRAQKGHEVLVLDFDFEAPGLHRYFLTDESTFDRYEPKGPAPRDGVLELFYALRERLEREWPDGEDFREPEAQARLPGILAELLEDESYGYRVRLKNPNKKGEKRPTIRFFPAVRFDDGYAERVRRFDWQRFYDAYAEVFPVLARELGKRYDDVLIDSRTGVTDVGSICTMLLPDKLVLAFAPNDQGLRGVLEAGFQATQERKESTVDRRPLPLFPLLSRLENSEETLKQAWIERARGGFQRMFRDAYEQEECDLETYFNLVRIPHQSFYAYGEMIAAERQAAQEMGSMAQAFSQFERCLECESAAKAQEMLLGLGEEERREIEREFEQGLIPVLTDPEKLAERIQQEPDRPALRFFQATRLLLQKQYEKAIEAYDEIVRLFGETADLDTHTLLAMTLINRGYGLGQLNREEEALKSYAEVAERYGQAPDAALRERVTMAFNGIGFTQLLQAKQHWLVDTAVAHDLLRKAKTSIDAALERNSDDPVYLGNAGYIAFLLGREGEARTLLGKAIRLGGESVREAELADTDLHPIPEDEAFRALVRSLPSLPPSAESPASPTDLPR